MYLFDLAIYYFNLNASSASTTLNLDNLGRGTAKTTFYDSHKQAIGSSTTTIDFPPNLLYGTTETVYYNAKGEKIGSSVTRLSLVGFSSNSTTQFFGLDGGLLGHSKANTYFKYFTTRLAAEGNTYATYYSANDDTLGTSDTTFNYHYTSWNSTNTTFTFKQPFSTFLKENAEKEKKEIEDRMQRDKETKKKVDVVMHAFGDQSKVLSFSKQHETKRKQEFLLSSFELKKLAESGDPGGQCMLGMALRQGLVGCNINKEEGNKYLAMAKEQATAAGLCAKGICLERGICGMSKDLKAAKECLSEAAGSGYVPALFYLATTLADEEDEAENALRTKHSNSAYPKALSEFIASRQEVRKQIIDMITTCSNQGFALAQGYLAWCNNNGWGCQKDPVAAAKLYSLAAEQGDATSRHNLACCYKTGTGIIQNGDEARRLFTLAANQGRSDSAYELGVCYRTGMGTPIDKKEALHWLNIAVERGHEPAKKALADLKASMSCCVML